VLRAICKILKELGLALNAELERGDRVLVSAVVRNQVDHKPAVAAGLLERVAKRLLP
jgi:hypothetical protein